MAHSAFVRLVPIAGWLAAYQRVWLRPDVIAGLSAAAVVVPQAMAYAAIAGLPIEVGLYTALIPMLAYVIFGSSRILSVSTTSTIAVLTAAEVDALAPGGDARAAMAVAASLALFVGVFLILAALLRLGFVSNFISDPVLVGFKAGIGLVILVNQLPKLFGLQIDKSGFFRTVVSIVQHLPQAHIKTSIIGLATLAVIIMLKRLIPRTPASLIAVGLGIVASAAFGLSHAGVSVVGKVPTGLPPIALPNLSLAASVWPGALGIALMCFTESIAAGRAFARTGELLTRPNQELFALGIANAAASFTPVMPAGGGTSQTAVNVQSGARTQIAQFVTFLLVVATLLFLASLIALMPLATLAAVVVATTIGLLNPKDFRAVLQIHAMEFWWSVAAFAGVVLLGTLNGILAAVGLSALALTYYANHPPLYALGRKPGTDVFRPQNREHPEDETFPGLLIVRTEGAMTFGSAPRLRDKMADLIEASSPRVIVLDLSAVPMLEYTALRMLTEFEKNLDKNGIALWLAALTPRVLETVQRAPLGKVLGRERMFFTAQNAVDAYRVKFER